MAEEKTRCSKKTKAGKPCKAWALSGRDFCMAHADEATRAEMGFGGPVNGAKGGAATRVPKPLEMARTLLEENAAVILRPHFRTLGYDVEVTGEGRLELSELEGGGAKVYGESKDGVINMSAYDDLAAMINAAEKLLDRIFGRPRQAMELTGDGGGPIETRELLPSDADFHSEVAAVLAEAEAAKTEG